MASLARIFMLGILPIISPAPVLDDGALWVIGESNSSDEAAVALLVGSNESFSCAEREDGMYRDPVSCTLHYRCSHGRREVYKCLDGYMFNPETVRCEEQTNVTCIDAVPDVCKMRGDGLYANQSSNCQEYYRCEERVLTDSYSCGPGYSFSRVTQGCVASNEVMCVEPYCGSTGNGFFIVPGTGCRAYYHCNNGVRTDYLCAPDTTFDREKELCIQTKGFCYEPLCTGRVNGRYPDTSHQCERSFECLGGVLQAVHGCPMGRLHNGHTCLSASTVSCQAPESTAVAIQVPASSPCTNLPDGFHAATPDDDCRSYILCKAGKKMATLRCPIGLRYNGRQCSEASKTPCLSDCVHRSDGYYTDIMSGCQNYYYCLGGQMTEHRTCAEGTLFNGHMCVPAQLFTCPTSSPVVQTNKCVSRESGFHTEYSRGCQEYTYCFKGKMLLEGSCASGQVWNGTTCVEHRHFLCKGPEPWPGCAGVETGMYQDHSTNCRYYYYCENGNRTQLACREGELFDGKMCVSADSYECPIPEPDICNQKPDGYYHNLDSSCRSYYYCSSGHKITYVCPGSYVFDGKECVDPANYKCLYTSKDCISHANGYHYDQASGCRKYFYCLEGDKITTLTCAGNKIFDGQRCVEPSEFVCPNSTSEKTCASRPDGLFVEAGSRCRRYIHCKNQKQVATSTCPDGKMFDGHACSEALSTDSCISAGAEPSPDCTNMLNGFYQNYTSGCHSYFYCINGMKTTLTCPGDEVFNGQLCVNPSSYTCLSSSDVPTKPCNNSTSEQDPTESEEYVILHIFPPT